MASTFSTNLKIELIGTGEGSGTWGNTTNENLGTAIEQALVGYGSVVYAINDNLTITLTNSNAAQAARALVLTVTSSVSLTATRELVVPTIQKQYIVQNNTTGAQSITVKTTAGSGVTIPNGRKAHLYVDGTNVIHMFDFVDINGGSIDGTPVGASAADTGAFTTLASSSTTTLNGTTVPASVTLVSTVATQTLTNKTISADNNTISGIAASSFVLSNGSGNLDGAAAQKVIPAGAVVGTTDTQTLTNKTLTAPTATGAILNDGYTEEVFAVTGTTPALSPTNGSIQTWTLSGNSTPTAGTWTAGQSITLMVDDGSAFSITWTSLAVTWKTDGGTAPTLNTTGFTVITLWKVGTTIYGARVGDA